MLDMNKNGAAAGGREYRDGTLLCGWNLLLEKYNGEAHDARKRSHSKGPSQRGTAPVGGLGTSSIGRPVGAKVAYPERYHACLFKVVFARQPGTPFRTPLDSS